MLIGCRSKLSFYDMEVLKVNIIEFQIGTNIILAGNLLVSSGILNNS